MDEREIFIAVADAIEATLDQSGWVRLAAVLDEDGLISGHPRLLRSLHFDDDYGACVIQVLRELADRHGLAAVAGLSAIEPWLTEHRPEGATLLLGRPSLDDGDEVEIVVPRDAAAAAEGAG